MITTERAELAERMRIFSLHGISRQAWNRYSAEGTWKYKILEAGYKYNLSDLQAAIGLIQLGKCHSMRDARSRIAGEYARLLSGQDAFKLPVIPVGRAHAWHLFVVEANKQALRINRDQVIDELKARGIGTSVHFIPLHLHPLYQNKLGYRCGQFPNAEERFAGAISLPIFPGMTQEELERVVEALRDIALEFRR